MVNTESWKKGWHLSMSTEKKQNVEYKKWLNQGKGMASRTFENEKKQDNFGILFVTIERKEEWLLYSSSYLKMGVGSEKKAIQ